MENWKALAFLLASGQGFVLSLSLIVRGARGPKQHIFLGLILLVLAQELLNAWGIQVHYHQQPDPFRFWNYQSYLVLPLSLWLFARLTTSPDFQFKKKYWLIYFPVVAEVGFRLFWRAYASSSNVKRPSLLENPIWFFLTEILPIAGMVIVLSLYAQKLNRFRLAWQQQLPVFSARHYLRLYGLFGFLTVLTFLWFAGVILEWPIFPVVNLLLTVCLFGLGYLGYLDHSFFMLPSLHKQKSADKPEFAQYDDLSQLQHLMAAFNQDGLHTRSRLTLEDVAAHLHLPVRYVSYLVNTHCASNFNNFVNGFRVQEVIRKLGDPKEQHKTVLALAFESGFNSKSTFNQVFRQHTGKSPSQYLQLQK
ncbi:helix-turn-helix domain-containing protein [Dyadobacter chenwenxiniae]|uniref:Helix-turn-helix domain-containing protein n=1 Tax=Dyadobacter chenwenxiniae TaxID=2906456 RepID=A0A9X1PJR4_9BACT|nr:helix-turn-helix domain-containing protein [Dyadobacter chenwenxiniae]MCF0062627.1 helix-turn-helix domain-containing protein [Dyadobacter chenwenxiniae]UON83628.1 helix-turn-helix domain-containing protein [Dyadobacter chenwenxiniae]